MLLRPKGVACQIRGPVCNWATVSVAASVALMSVEAVTHYFEGTHLTMIALGDGQTKSLLKFSDSPHVDLRGALLIFSSDFHCHLGLQSDGPRQDCTGAGAAHVREGQGSSAPGGTSGQGAL